MKLRKEVKLDYRLATIRDVSGIIAEAISRGRVSIDLETDGFDPFLNQRKIISIQVCSVPGRAYYLRWDQQVGEAFTPLFGHKEVIKCFHNGKFDIKWLAAAGFKVLGPIDDTLIGIHLLDENFRGKDLDTLATHFTKLKNPKQDMKKYMKANKVDFKDIPMEIMLPYGCGDADATIRLSKKFHKRIVAEGLENLYAHEMRKLKLFVEVERNGCKIDTGILDELAEKYERTLRIVQKRLNRKTSRELNVNSPKQVCEILYGKWKLPPLGRPKVWGGAPVENSAEETLLKLLELEEVVDDKREVIQSILEYREHSKLLSNYVLGMSDFLREGSLVHPNFKLTGTVTGRLSCADPNLQNIPRSGDIKRLFISRYGRRGRIMQVDVSQGELRWAAQYSSEPTLIKYFRSGVKDIHRAVAAKVLGCSEESVTTEQRKKAKLVNFGVLYGISPKGLFAKNRDFNSIEEASSFMADWNAEFPKWGDYVEKVKSIVIRDLQVSSLFGRIRRLPTDLSRLNRVKIAEAFRQAVNSPIQGTLCDYTILCGYNARYRLPRKRIHFIAQVHDAWVLDVHEDHIDEVARVFFEEFRVPNFREFDIKLKLPMDVEISVGPNWKEQEVYASV